LILSSRNSVSFLPHWFAGLGCCVSRNLLLNQFESCFFSNYSKCIFAFFSPVSSTLPEAVPPCYTCFVSNPFTVVSRNRLVAMCTLSLFFSTQAFDLFVAPLSYADHSPPSPFCLSFWAVTHTPYIFCVSFCLMFQLTPCSLWSVFLIFFLFPLYPLRGRCFVLLRLRNFPGPRSSSPALKFFFPPPLHGDKTLPGSTMGVFFLLPLVMGRFLHVFAPQTFPQASPPFYMPPVFLCFF